MMALSLWQPWASLWAIGAKQHETRSWETLHRGPIAIHAAKKWSGELEDLCLRQPFRRALAAVMDPWQRPREALPFGCIIGVATLVDCVLITPDTTPWSSDERAFGDYTPGRFRLDFEERRWFSPPVPYRGRQRLFQVPDQIIADALAGGVKETPR